MEEFAKNALNVAKQIQADVHEVSEPPAEGSKPKTNQVVNPALFKGTRGYLIRVVNQINGTYEKRWNDACAVMLRRLIETLIIDVYERNQIDNKIKDANGNFLLLEKLIDQASNESSLNLGRDSKKALSQLKKLGDRSAHHRRVYARREDISNHLFEIDTMVQELIFLADNNQ